MVYSISIEPYSVKESYTYGCKYKDFMPYSLFCIDKESYMCGTVIENSDEGYIPKGRLVHNLHIGRYCSMAHEIYFLIGRGKNYSRVTHPLQKYFKITLIFAISIMKREVLLYKMMYGLDVRYPLCQEL